MLYLRRTWPPDPNAQRFRELPHGVSPLSRVPVRDRVAPDHSSVSANALEHARAVRTRQYTLPQGQLPDVPRQLWHRRGLRPLLRTRLKTAPQSEHTSVSDVGPAVPDAVPTGRSARLAG
jgi:hypothetical protein